jgi:hypothetical protein
VGFLERDQAAGELEEREVVLVVLRPADQDPAVSVEPGVGGLDDPAAGAPAWGADLVGDLFAAGADVRRELVRADEVADVCVVVGPVEAEALGTSGVGVGRSIGIESSVSFRRRWSLRLAPLCSSPTGTPFASTRTDRFALF